MELLRSNPMEISIVDTSLFNLFDSFRFNLFDCLRIEKWDPSFQKNF